jgi:uncharacterized protein YjbI with pentapeptide repeats
MSSNDPTNRKQIEELEKTVRKLQSENNILQQRLKDSQLARIIWLKRIKSSLRIMILGPTLNNAFQAWLSSYEASESFPKQETIDILTAIFQRIIRVGFVGVLITSLPTFVMIWQNILLLSQLHEQQFTNYINRKSELTSILYETTCKSSELHDDYRQVPVSSCPPRASKRVRSEAARSLVETERLFGRSPDLTGALLSETWLLVMDFSEANLYYTDFRSANLGGAKFHKALLDQADFHKANLTKADFSKAIIQDVSFVDVSLSGADFRNAELYGVDFRHASLQGARFNSVDFHGSDLRDANLHGSDLRDANLEFSDLTGADLNRSFYNDETNWPSQFDVTRSGAIKCESILVPHLPSNKSIAKEPCQ